MRDLIGSPIQLVKGNVIRLQHNGHALGNVARLFFEQRMYAVAFWIRRAGLIPRDYHLIPLFIG